jgi:hypothetical protein
MTPLIDGALLDRLEAALALHSSPSAREIADLRALVADPLGSAYDYPRLAVSQPRSRNLVRAVAAAVVTAIAIAIPVVVARDDPETPASSRPSAVAPLDPTVPPALESADMLMSAVRDALARGDIEAVVSARDELVRALAALSPSARAQVQTDAESLLSDVDRFLADATRPRAADPPASDPSAEPDVVDEPSDDVTQDVVVPSSPSRSRDDSESEDD